MLGERRRRSPSIEPTLYKRTVPAACHARPHVYDLQMPMPLLSIPSIIKSRRLHYGPRRMPCVRPTGRRTCVQTQTPVNGMNGVLGHICAHIG